jgi:voltage-gated potassium channel
MATITTVGYGDRYPVSPEGRAIATMLMTAGLGLFGTLSGVVAAGFLSPYDGQHASAIEQKSEVAELRETITELRAAIGELRRAPGNAVSANLPVTSFGVDLK